jgi:hypothetical protein
MNLADGHGHGHGREPVIWVRERGAALWRAVRAREAAWWIYVNVYIYTYTQIYI